MEINHRTWYIRGIRDGIPIALGYLAVSFSLGIAAGNICRGVCRAFADGCGGCLYGDGGDAVYY